MIFDELFNTIWHHSFNDEGYAVPLFVELVVVCTVRHDIERMD